MVGRSPRLRRREFKPELREIERVDEGINHSNGITLVDPVLKAFWKKRRLIAIQPFNKRLI